MAEKENIDQKEGGPERTGTRRILVALDASPNSLAAVEIAAGIAARLQAEMHGVFVEDSMLLELAEYPFVRTMSLLSGRRVTLKRQDVEQTLKRQAGEAQQAVSIAASRHRVSASFQVRRGRISAEVAASATERDVILISRKLSQASGLPVGRPAPPGETVRELLKNSSHSILILGDMVSEPENIFVAYDGSPASEKALMMAADLVDRRRPRALTVLILAGDEGSADPLREQAEAALFARGQRATLRTVALPTVDKLCINVSSLRPGLLVLGTGQNIQGKDVEQELLDKTPCSIMLVR